MYHPKLHQINCSLLQNLKLWHSTPLATAVKGRPFSELAIRKAYPLLSKTPYKLAYIKPCKCCQLEPYTHLNPQSPNAALKGSLDSFNLPDDCPLEDDCYYRREVAVSQDGLLHPSTACEVFAIRLVRQAKDITDSHTSPKTTWSFPEPKLSDQICSNPQQKHKLLFGYFEHNRMASLEGFRIHAGAISYMDHSQGYEVQNLLSASVRTSLTSVT